MDIDDITQRAKETLLQSGQHAPTFFIERKGGQVDMVILDHLEDTTHAKMEQFFTAARGLARKRQWKIKEVSEVIFIVEAWTSSYKPGEKPKYARPADDPERREVLAVSKLAVVPPPPTRGSKPKLETSVQFIEMLRDGSGDLVELLPMPEVKECDHRLLRAFLAGIASARFTEKQLVAMGRRLP